jgi:hypothetical protein
MSKKKRLPQKTRRTASRSTGRKYLGVAALVLMLTLCLGTVVGPWRNSSGAKRLRAFFAAPVPAPSLPPSNNPSREYIYAGGKLIATEAPVTLAAPLNLAALTLSNLQTPQVSISWTQTDGADHYQVERTTNVATNFTTINTDVTSTTFTDNTVGGTVTAYLYRVRAVDSIGNVSPYSNIDLATAISFTDDSIVSGVTPIKAAHINEVRQAVDAVRRVTANLGDVNWGGSITPDVTTVQATHIQDLRMNLDQARSALGLPQCSYTDNSVEALRTVFIKKEHIDQLRGCVR